MLRLDQIKLHPDQGEDALRARAARLLRVPEDDILALRVLRRAVDAREELCLVYTLAVEVANERQALRRREQLLPERQQQPLETQRPERAARETWPHIRRGSWPRPFRPQLHKSYP